MTCKFMTSAPPPPPSESRSGFFSGVLAYTMWGLFPIYFVATRTINPLELLSHRIVWAVPFGLLIILARKQIFGVVRALKQPKVLALLTLAALALSINWGVYIWAIQQDQIFQGSLGYYINPLLYVLVGVVFLGEKLSKLQAVAASLAFLGVIILTVYGGVFPAISLILAATFTIYGVIRKQVNIGAMPGLFIETLVMLPAGALFLLWLHHSGTLDFTSATPAMKGLLIFAGPVTVLPLLAFAFAARRLKLSTLGFLQYIGPTLQFGCALYYGEAFTIAHAICFTFIWLAVLLFSWDAWKSRPRAVKPVNQPQ